MEVLGLLVHRASHDMLRIANYLSPFRPVSLELDSLRSQSWTFLFHFDTRPLTQWLDEGLCPAYVQPVTYRTECMTVNLHLCGNYLTRRREDAIIEALSMATGLNDENRFVDAIEGRDSFVLPLDKAIAFEHRVWGTDIEIGFTLLERGL